MHYDRVKDLQSVRDLVEPLDVMECIHAIFFVVIVYKSNYVRSNESIKRKREKRVTN